MENYKLSEEEKRILQEHKKLENEGMEKEKLFWIESYPNYSNKEKEDYWLADIHHGMRSQGDMTGDKYTEFSVKWYEDVKLKEPGFDDIFKKLVLRLGFDFNWDTYNERIHSNKQ